MIGLRILNRARAVDLALARSFLGVPVANVSDCMGRMIAGGAHLRPYHKAGGMVGPAFTVKARPGDNLMIHKALHLAQPGDVIVVDGGGDLTNALMGELMVATAIKRGLGGIVLNGAIRESKVPLVPQVSLGGDGKPGTIVDRISEHRRTDAPAALDCMQITRHVDTL